MDITENKLQQIIIEELKQVLEGTLGMDQEYTGSEMDVDAENDLAGALMALQNAGYTHEEVVDMVDDAYGVTGTSKKVDPSWARRKYAPMKGDKTPSGKPSPYSKHLDEPEARSRWEKERYDEAMALEDCGCPSCPEHGSGAKIRVKVK